MEDTEDMSPSPADGLSDYELDEESNNIILNAKNDPEFKPSHDIAPTYTSVDEDAKGRFNLRKRSTVFTGDEDFISDDEDVLSEICGPEPKKMKKSSSKQNKKSLRPYSNEAVKTAVKMVQTKKMSILEASRTYNIPRTSLHNFVSLYKKGRRVAVQNLSPALANSEEKEIVELVSRLCRCGKRYSHNELRFLVQLYLINNDRPVFKSGTLPTMGWIAGLVERHPELIKAKSKKNTKVAAEDVEEWEENISEFLISDWNMDLDEMFCDANRSRIFCYTVFRMLINGPGEIGAKSSTKKEFSENTKADQEVCIILGMSAMGDFDAPLVVFSEEHKELCRLADTDELKTMYSASGRIEPEVALRVVKELNHKLERDRVQKPVIYFVNDKQDFAHFSVIEYCWENQICIVCLPPRTVKTMTPFEVSLWPKMRAAYATLWKSADKTADNKIFMEDFPSLVQKAWESVKNVRNAMRSFNKSGLIPFDVKAILGDCPTIQEPQIKQEIKSPSPEKQVAKPGVKELSSSEEKTRGKIEGIQMCLEAIESFIPPDILPIWNQREPNYRGRCELAFKLWRSVSLLLKAGIAMASIQQMTDGLDLFDNASALFNEGQNPTTPIKKENLTTPSPVFKKGIASPIQTKRKLNRSIYSNSEEYGTRPFVKMYPNSLYSRDGSPESDTPNH